MLKRRSRLAWAVVVYVVVVTALVLGGIHYDLAWADQVASVGSLLLALATFLMTRPQRAPMAEISTEQARDGLAKALRIRLDREEQLRKINDPRPLPVRWEVRHAPAGTGGDFAGSYDRVFDTFERLPARRLVILGEAGAGKTVLLNRLALDLLRSRGADDPVPVLFSMASWRATGSFAGWLAAELIREHPDLAARTPSPIGPALSLAADLVASNAVLPVLDGFDELPAARRAEAFAAVNAYGSHHPLVLASRPAEFDEATAAARRDLAEAVVVELRPLEPADVGVYLRRVERHGRWRVVVDRLAEEPSGPLAATMTNPLMLWLARTVHQAPGSDPAWLAEPGRSRAAMEKRLFDAFVPAIYGSGRAERHLSFLARHLERTGAGEFAWWQLHPALCRWSDVSAAIRWGARTLAMTAIVVWLLARHDAGPAALDSVLTGPVGVLFLVMARSLAGTALSAWEDALSMVPMVDLGGIDLVGPCRSFAATGVGAAIILITALVCAHALRDEFDGVPDGVPVALSRRPWRVVRGFVGECFGATLSVGLVVVMFWFSASPEARAEATGSLTPMPGWPPLTALLLVLVGVVAVPLAAPVDVTRVVSPREVLTLDRRVFFLSHAAATVQRGVLVWALCGWRMLPIYLGYAALALALRPLIGSPPLAHRGSASQSYADARLWLALTGRLPWSTMAFLDRAHRLGVLRQTGATYHFRHIRLQQHLAGRRAPDRPVEPARVG